MAALSTRKKSNSVNEQHELTPEIIEKLASYTAKYITHWTCHELQKFLLMSKVPICLITGKDGSMIVGRFSMSFDANATVWMVQHILTGVVLEFQQKQSAVFYCICYTSGRVFMAQDILTQDQQVNKIRTDLAQYEHRLTQKLKKHDNFGADVCRSRISDSRAQLKLYTSLLQKNIKRAKYLKVWSPE